MANKPKVFISHSWEDNAISREIAKYLKRDGAEIWIDYARIKGGQSLPQRISEALEWCDTLILFWSQAAKNSYYVNLEWENALDLRKDIIPCLLDGVERPAILRRCLYVDFRDPEIGYPELARALNLSIKKETSKVEPVPPHEPIHLGLRPPLPMEVKPVTGFRSESRTLSEKEVKAMLVANNFFDKYENKNGSGYKHDYKIETLNGDQVVLDRAAGLMWQQGGSPNYINYEEAKKWIDNLNLKGYAGFKDWRLPTLEEAMSLMEPKKMNGDLYIDPVFDKTQSWIWTADPIVGSAAAWVVGFDSGCCNPVNLLILYNYVRAVRSGLSSQE